MSQADEIEKRSGVVTFKGEPITLIGPEVEVDQEAPEFVGIGRDLSECRLADYGNKIKVFSVMPSLDTPVCDLQLRQFEEIAKAHPQDLMVVGVSMDLPFAQKRFCLDADLEHADVVSDHRFASFGTHYGVLIDELRLLTRAVFVLDRDNVVRYVEYVPEVTDSPRMEEAKAAIEALLS